MPDFENILIDREGTDGRVARITLNRPEKMNALSQDLLFELNDARKTPAEEYRDNLDYEPLAPVSLLPQHFSAIAAAGPIVGPILAGLMFGWLPALIWILVGSILIGGKVCSRREGATRGWSPFPRSSKTASRSWSMSAIATSVTTMFVTDVMTVCVSASFSVKPTDCQSVDE